MKRSFRLTDRRSDAARDVRDELQFYLDMRARELIEQGMAPDDARRAAVAAFGDVSGIEAELRALRIDRARERRRRDWWHGVTMDLVYALRTLRASPAFTAATLGTLALGIGATIAVFTVVNGVLLRPLPYREPARVAMVWLVGDETSGTSDELPLSSGFYLDLQRQARSFERLAAFRSWTYTLGDGDPEQLAGARVSPSLFDVLGVRPLMGRGFTGQEALPGGAKVALISYDLWQRRFGGDATIAGKQITLSGESFTVTGVMPRGFAFPRGAELPAGMQFGARTDLWTPLVFEAKDRANFGTLNLSAAGRLQPGVAPSQAAREAHAILQRFLKERNAKVRLDYHVLTLRDQAGAHVRRTLLVLMGAVALVLIVACANVTSLLLARTAAREREFALRTALGAGRGRLAQQLVTENGILATVGAALGVLLAVAGSRAMLALVPGGLPRSDDIAVDWRVLVVAASVAVVAATLFAFGTALSVRWAGLAATLQAAGARTTAGVARRLGRRLLVTAEVALSVMLLIGAALLTRTFVELQRVRPGFDPTHVLTAGVVLPIPGTFDPSRDGPRWTTTFAELERRLRESGAVKAVGGVSSLPLTGAVESARLSIVGRTPPPGSQGPMAQYAVVSGAYFDAMRIALLAGRVFDSRDDAGSAPVIIVNREFVRRYLAGDSPVGKLVTSPFDFQGGARQRAIVGVVDDVKQVALDEAPTPQVYVPQAQMPYPGLTFVVRTDGDPVAALPVIKRELRAVNPTLAAHDVRTLEAVMGSSLARQRFTMTLIAIFAASALALAVIGLYGVIALGVSQRRREIGVRLALGARRADVVRLVLADGLRMTATGIVLGMGGALLLGRALAALLYGVSATDAQVFAVAAAFVALVSLAASYLPAKRASAMDPTVALRAE